MHNSLLVILHTHLLLSLSVCNTRDVFKERLSESCAICTIHCFSSLSMTAYCLHESRLYVLPLSVAIQNKYKHFCLSMCLDDTLYKLVCTKCLPNQLFGVIAGLCFQAFLQELFTTVWGQTALFLGNLPLVLGLASALLYIWISATVLFEHEICRWLCCISEVLTLLTQQSTVKKIWLPKCNLRCGLEYEYEELTLWIRDFSKGLVLVKLKKSGVTNSTTLPLSLGKSDVMWEVMMLKPRTKK